MSLRDVLVEIDQEAMRIGKSVVSRRFAVSLAQGRTRPSVAVQSATITRPGSVPTLQEMGAPPPTVPRLNEETPIEALDVDTRADTVAKRLLSMFGVQALKSLFSRR